MPHPSINGTSTLGRGRGGVRGPHGSHTHTWLLHPQIWYLLEGSYRVYQLFPSKGWEVYISLQIMQQSSLYASKETMVTLFYEERNLYQVPGGGCGETLGSRSVADTNSHGPAFPLQLVYLSSGPQSHLVKRLVPLDQLLMYQQISNHYLLQQQG